jgi:hypothetical protein
MDGMASREKHAWGMWALQLSPLAKLWFGPHFANVKPWGSFGTL